MLLSSPTNTKLASALLPLGVPVSVIIPCFRCSATIRRAVASVMRQTCLPAEIILVDDSSGDTTLPTLHQLQHEFPSHIVVLPLPSNSGAGDARNAGWNLAKHEYIAFLDADDTWHPRKIEIQYAFMRDNPQLILSSHDHEILSSSPPPPADWPLNGPLLASPILKWPLLLSNRFITPSVMLKRDVPQRFEPGQRHMEDHMLWLRLLLDGGSIMKLNLSLAAIHKAPYGVSGLSSHLWAMEKAELCNFRRIWHMNNISGGQCLLLSLFSLVKFIRRIFLSWLRSMFRRFSKSSI